MKERHCSFKDCGMILSYEVSLTEFSKNWNSKIIQREIQNIKDLFEKIWNNEKIAIFCCSHTKQINLLIKDQKKNNRLITRSQKISAKYKLKFEQ